MVIGEGLVDGCVGSLGRCRGNDSECGDFGGAVLGGFVGVGWRGGGEGGGDDGGEFEFERVKGGVLVGGVLVMCAGCSELVIWVMRTIAGKIYRRGKIWENYSSLERACCSGGGGKWIGSIGTKEKSI